MRNYNTTSSSFTVELGIRWNPTCLLTTVLKKDYYRPQRSWAKVIFSQACVKNSVHRGGGGCLPQCILGYTPRTRHPPWAQTPLPPQSRHPLQPAEQTLPPGADTPPPPGSRLQHTVNERPVRILLECILIYCDIRFSNEFTNSNFSHRLR